MTRNQTLVGTMLGRIVPVAAILLLIVGAPVFMTLSAWAAIDTFIRIVGVDGASKDPAHMNWITVSSVVAQDLNGDAQADRESVMPSISETVVKSTAPGSGAGGGKAKSADVATGQATGRRMHKPLHHREGNRQGFASAGAGLRVGEAFRRSRCGPRIRPLQAHGRRDQLGHQERRRSPGRDDLLHVSEDRDDPLSSSKAESCNLRAAHRNDEAAPFILWSPPVPLPTHYGAFPLTFQRKMS